MSGEFLIAVIEPQDDIIFVGGAALGTLAEGDTFTALYRYQGSKKSKKQVASVKLTITALIADGEPVTSAAAEDEVLLSLAGDAAALLSAADDARWKRKKGRYLRSGKQALTVSTE